MGSACTTRCSSTTLTHGGVGMMVVVILEGVQIPSISFPSNIVRVWNEHIIDKVEGNIWVRVLSFAQRYYIDWFCPNFKKVWDDVKSFALPYNFNPFSLIGGESMRWGYVRFGQHFDGIEHIIHTSLLFIANYNNVHTLHWFAFAFVNNILNVSTFFFCCGNGVGDAFKIKAI